MASVGIEISLEGDQTIQAALEAVRRRGLRLHPVMGAIGDMLLNSTKARFETSTAPDGQKWAPIKPATYRNRVRRVQKSRAGKKAVGPVSNQPLVDQGYLSHLLSSRPGADSVRVGSSRIYARIHQFGGTINQPAREGSVRLRQVSTTSKTGKQYKATQFAKAKHKRVQKRDAQIGAHTVVIPARPFLGASAADRGQITLVLIQHIMDGPIAQGGA
jgi:phage virion morphogenesis protein